MDHELYYSGDVDLKLNLRDGWNISLSEQNFHRIKYISVQDIIDPGNNTLSSNWECVKQFEDVMSKLLKTKKKYQHCGMCNNMVFLMPMSDMW